MIDARTRTSIDERTVREHRAKRLAETLVHDNVLWVGSKVYDIRFLPKAKKNNTSRKTQPLAGIEVIPNLYISGHGTFFVPDNDLFGRFYNHVDVSDLTDNAIDRFLGQYAPDRF